MRAIYLDTHAVIHFYNQEIKRYSAHALKLLRSRAIKISPMVLLELEYLRELGRLNEGSDVLFEGISDLQPSVCDIPFASVIAKSIQLGWTRDPFDRIIVGTAIAAGNMPLITTDGMVQQHYKHAVR